MAYFLISISKIIDIYNIFAICTLDKYFKGLIPLDLPAEEMKKLACKRIKKGVDEYLIVVQVTKIDTFFFSTHYIREWRPAYVGTTGATWRAYLRGETVLY